MKIRTEIMGRLGLIIGSLLIILLTLEIILRIMGLHRPVLYRADEVAGYALLENQETTYLLNTIRVNNLGLRDLRDLFPNAEKNVYRIGIFGDSVTWGGVYIAQNELFTSLLENKLLERHPGNNIQVLNGGINGYSVKQAIERAKSVMAQTDFDTLVLFLIEEDFYRNPEVILKQDAVPLYQSYRRTALGQIWDVSKAVIYQKKGWEFFRTPTAVEEKEYLDEKEVYARNMQSLITFTKNLKEQNKRILVFLSPAKINLSSDSATYKNLSQHLSTQLPHFYDLLPDFREQTDSESYYYDAVHFNELGHQAAAELMDTHLRNLLAL